MDSKALEEIESEKKGSERASLELLYHVSREFAGALDLRTVLQRVLFLSMQTVKAVSGSIVVLDDQENLVESAIINGSQFSNNTTQRLRFTMEKGLAGWVVRHREPVLVTNTSEDIRWIRRDSDPYDFNEPKSVVSAPLLVRERLVGVITLANNSPGFFTSDHLNLVKAIADQASIAVLNGRLYTESQRHARVMSALAASAAAINASLNIEDVLMRILEQIQQALRVETVSLALLDPTKKELVFWAAIGWQIQEADPPRIKVGQGIAGWAAREGQGVVIQDVDQDPRFDPETDQRTNQLTRSASYAPIFSREEVIGVLEALNPRENAFDPDALVVLTGIASLAGTAINNAQMFERLEAAHKRYRELFEDSIEPILITDWEGRILEANRQAIHTSGLCIEDLKKLEIGNLHSLDQEKLGSCFQNLNEGTTVSYDSVLFTSTGRVVPVTVRARQVFFEDVTYLQWILRDISERKNLDSLREDLLAMVYHDLRSPLANIVSSLDAIETLLTEDSDPTLTSLLSISMRSAGRIERMTNSLLDINHLEAGQSLGNRLPYEVVDIIRDSIETVLPNLQAKKQTLLTDLNCQNSLSKGDYDMIRRVITNLLENAIKFTPNGGIIEVGMKNCEELIEIYVKDNGPGIPSSVREQIFDKFSRIASPGAPRGLGLGLTFCRLAVEAHGGRIWVENKAGEGARFTFTLPVLPI
jgi:two-component system, NtrC family, sensor histidine kinase KinB